MTLRIEYIEAVEEMPESIKLKVARYTKQLQKRQQIDRAVATISTIFLLSL